MSGQFTAWLRVAALLVAAWFPLRHAGETQFDADPGFAIALPEHVGSWTGEAVFQCTGKSCGRMVLEHARREDGSCPTCGAHLDTMAAVERQLLPSDTELLRKRYRNVAGDEFYVTLVVSGRERASIHRPEVCLSYPGNEIIRSEPLPVTNAGPAILRTTLLTQRTATTRGPAESFFAYWFVARGCETPSHWQRMIWMATDRILRGQTRRWAYLSVAGPNRTDAAKRDQLRDFIGELAKGMRALRPEAAPAP